MLKGWRSPAIFTLVILHFGRGVGFVLGLSPGISIRRGSPGPTLATMASGKPGLPGWGVRRSGCHPPWSSLDYSGRAHHPSTSPRPSCNHVWYFSIFACTCFVCFSSVCCMHFGPIAVWWLCGHKGLEGLGSTLLPRFSMICRDRHFRDSL